MQLPGWDLKDEPARGMTVSASFIGTMAAAPGCLTTSRSTVTPLGSFTVSTFKVTTWPV